MQKTVLKRIKSIDKSTFSGILRLIAGFLLGAARIGAIRPFGIGYAAGSRDDDLWRFCGAFLGSITVSAGQGGILYAAAVMICFAFRMVFRETKIGKNRAFLPLCAGLSVICIKAQSLLSGVTASGVIILLFEGAFAVGVSLLFSLSKGDKPQGAYYISRAVMLIAALFAFEPMRILGLFSMARIVATITVIVVAYFYGSGTGAGVGIAIGALFDMAVFHAPEMAFIYGLGGLLCGGGKTSPRLMRGIMWIVGCVSAYVWCKTNMVGTLAECILCGVGVCALPSGTWEKLAVRFNPTKDAPRYEVSPEISVAISKMGEEIGETVKARRGNEMQKVLDRASDEVCVTCAQAKECWRDDYVATSAALVGVGAVAKEKSEVGLDDFPRHFLKKCIKAEQFCKEINRQLRASRSRVGAAKRKEEAAALMKRQYEGISALFSDISLAKDNATDKTLACEVVWSSQPRKNEKQCGDSVCHFVTGDGRQIVLLSDGMGSGNKAAEASHKTLKMLKELILAGAGLIAAAEAIAPVLEAKFESWGFVTLDGLEINLCSGEAVFVKCGASPSCILRGEARKNVWKQSLPAGLGGEAAILKATLKSGDRVIMTSDGVSIPQEIKGEAQEICTRLMKGKNDDDKTVLAVSVMEVQ